jgi:hypothetical protein
MAQELLQTAESEVVVYETDSLAPALAPDLAVFVAGQKQSKPGADRCRRIADIVVVDTRTGRERDVVS